MKALLFLIAVSVLLSVLSCSKDDDNNNNTNSGTWKLGATNYNAVYVTSAGSKNLAAFDSIPNSGTSPTNTNSILIMFAARPTVSRNYNIVNAINSGLGPNDVAVSAKPKTGNDSYFSIGITNDAVPAIVTVLSDGKIKVNIQDTWVTKLGTGDSLLLSANVTEQ